MKKDNPQNFQEDIDRSNSREEQQNPNTTISIGQQNDTPLQAGLGRDRMTDIEDLDGMGEREDYAGDDDLTNENLNAANDQ